MRSSMHPDRHCTSLSRQGSKLRCSLSAQFTSQLSVEFRRSIDRSVASKRSKDDLQRKIELAHALEAIVLLQLPPALAVTRSNVRL